MLVCHHCDNPPCCNPAHHFLGTKSDNALDAVKKGLWGTYDRKARAARGEQSGGAKLTTTVVLEIRACAAAGVHLGEIALHYGIHRDHARRIVTRKSWAHVSTTCRADVPALGEDLTR
jgi:hypothetical protein